MMTLVLLEQAGAPLKLNKPGTTNVSAISKARNCKKGPFVKLQLVAKYQSKKIEGGPFGDIKKIQ